jgi:hypothetical protein
MDMALVIYVWIHGNLSKPNNVVQIKSQQRNFLTSEKGVPGELSIKNGMNFNIQEISANRHSCLRERANLQILLAALIFFVAMRLFWPRSAQGFLL